MEKYCKLQYEQYRSVIESGQLSLDALKRIIKHDRASGWTNTPGGLARIKVAKDCESEIIKVGKYDDEVGDYLYGVGWPLPLEFKRVEKEKTKFNYWG